MSSISEEYISAVLSDFATKYNLKNWRYTMKHFESIAQNYFGVLIPIFINGEKDANNVSLDVVMKLAPNDERYRVSGAITLMFAREIFVYSILFKNYSEIQDCTNLDFIMPECYYISKDYCKEAIIMQNMCANGYKPVNNKFINIDHIVLSVKSLAKFHALSFILKDNKPVSACLIDYQTARISSSAFDVLYLICSSTDSELRKNHYYHILDEYYDTFCQSLGNGGLDPRISYSRQMFDEDLRVVGPACFIIANTALWLSSGLQQEGHVRSKQVLITDVDKMNAVNGYKSVIKDIIDDLYIYGYFRNVEAKSNNI